MTDLNDYSLDYNLFSVGKSLVIHADCFEWMSRIPKDSIHAIVTDPPYGVKEYDFEQIEKRTNGSGGTWRIPPSFDGSNRAPLPRFTALSQKELHTLQRFFYEWGVLALRTLRPGGHIFIATNAFLSQLVFSSLVKSGLEFRGELIRLVRTFRGGDRPKNAEEEFPEVCSLPRSAYEPWGIFRKPLPAGMKVSECLRTYETGGLRRVSIDQPFADVIMSERTSQKERLLADHPSLKPQSFLRQVVRAALPLGKGVVLDPFMGSGSTVAAAEALDLTAIGVERFVNYFDMSRSAILALTKVQVKMDIQQLEIMDLSDSHAR